MIAVYDKQGRFSGHFPPTEFEEKSFEMKLSALALKKLNVIDKKHENGEISDHDHEVMSAQILKESIVKEQEYVSKSDKRILGKCKR
jgi:hypothetical protein